MNDIAKKIFLRSIDVYALRKNADGSQLRVLVTSEFHSISVTVGLDAIARQLAERAVKSKRGKAVYLKGAVLVQDMGKWGK